MFVAVCDDDFVFRKIIKDLLLTYKNEHRICLDIIEFSNGHDLLQSNIIFDIIFLDYQMPDLNGFETAKKLRNRNVLASIIFTTAYPNFVLDSFEVEPFRFLVKPIDKQQIYSSLDNFIQKQKLLYPIIFNDNGEQKTINSYDIIYVEGNGKNSIIITSNGYFKVSKTLSNIQELLPKHCFYRTHKSYLINMYFVSKIHKNKIFFTNNQVAILSKPLTKTFKKDYMNFIKNFYFKV